MSMITDWLMVGITLVYAIVTYKMCNYTSQSVKATKEQITESMRQFEETKRQYEESKRLETMPFLQLELHIENKTPLFELELDLCNGNETGVIYKTVLLKNIGNGTRV